MMVETFRESRMWPSLVSLSDPVHVLEAQNLAAHIFLLTHGDTRLSPGQRRLLQLRPKLRAHLKASCACGCKKPPSETSNFCSGCKRAYYVSKQCQTEYETTLSLTTLHWLHLLIHVAHGTSIVTPALGFGKCFEGTYPFLRWRKPTPTTESKTVWRTQLLGDCNEGGY